MGESYWRAVFLTLALLCISEAAWATVPQTQNVILVTLDGLRPEELFSGAEQRLIDKDIGGVSNPAKLRKAFWHEDPLVRRKRLMPFLWSVIANEGQIFGSSDDDCEVWVRNGKYFSYPGYQELLCGFPDAAIDSNDKIYNENTNVLEWIHDRPEFSGKVAVFSSWDTLPYIINSKRSGIHVNSGWQEFKHGADPVRREMLNRAVGETPHYWENSRFDYLTFAGALEYTREHQPRVLYLSLDETDSWCHSGRYDLYLEAANRCDRFLRQLWEFTQNSEGYRGRTSLVVAVDHGRGSGREGWKNHSADLPGSERIWIAVLGPDTPALGVRKNVEASQGQVAATVAALLGLDYSGLDNRIASPLPGVLPANIQFDSLAD
ncbi:AP protein [Adhaeretor mobilis]|uniref:AP protein n=1 Tax=Adhaeretor mobilis TaxID=1930276 RepID=A0A517MVE1_9BACT|nr:AP protein [Adhaeretor mobilis]QDS98845.1 hypothetical protein HG15A2_21300 [Adhaeretor mobilis]